MIERDWKQSNLMIISQNQHHFYIFYYECHFFQNSKNILLFCTIEKTRILLKSILFYNEKAVKWL